MKPALDPLLLHTPVQTKEPVSEGIVSLLEPFIDTMVICTLTSLLIVSTAYPAGLMDSGLEGIELTSAAFAYHISWAPCPWRSRDYYLRSQQA